MTFFEIDRKRREVVDEISKQLLAFGYVDAIIDGFGSCTTKSGERVLNKSAQIYFWNRTHGYEISIYYVGDAFDRDDFVSDCKKIISFAKNTSVLDADCTHAWKSHLMSQGFSEFKESPLFSIIEEGFTKIILSNPQYHLYFFKQEVAAAISEPDEELKKEWEEEFEEESCAYLKSEIIKCIAENKLDSNYQYEIAFRWDTISLTVYKFFVKYNLLIRQYKGYGELGYQIRYIVDCFVKQIKNNTTNLLSDLDWYDFHVHSQSADRLSAIVCKELDVFAIAAWSEDLAANKDSKVSLLSTKPAITFDDLNGNEFENFCAKVLRYNGFEKVSLTQGSGDQGVDIIAYKDSIKYGIQCKCYSADIGNKAVQEVLAGKTFYDCDVGVVLTNRHFTKSAVELAKKSRIRLWDRDKLLQMVSAMNM